METICGATFVFDHDGEPDLIGNELTGGACRVMVGRAPAAEGPPMQIHPHTDEGFYVGRRATDALTSRSAECAAARPRRFGVAFAAPRVVSRALSAPPRALSESCDSAG